MTSPLVFTAADTERLGRTADALTAYMGKPVLAEILLEPDAGFEWVLFAVPLAPEEDPADQAIVQVGGPNTRLLGNRGGLDTSDEQPLECALLWAIQRTRADTIRYIKVDGQGEEVGWSETLDSRLPFDLQEPDMPDDEPQTPDVPNEQR